jgi:hypothetical protein
MGITFFSVSLKNRVLQVSRIESEKTSFHPIPVLPSLQIYLLAINIYNPVKAERRYKKEIGEGCFVPA